MKMKNPTSKRRTLNAVGSDALVRRPLRPDAWTRGFCSAIGKLLRRYGLDCPPAAALFRYAGNERHVLANADMDDIEVLRDAGLLPPNAADEQRRGKDSA